MNEYDSEQDTLAHIATVNKYMSRIIMELAERGAVHDASKLEEPEKTVFDKVTPALKGLTYGSPEYNQSLSEMKPALVHHYNSNRHHPEHFKNGMQDMTILDLVEMFCDWCAATERHDDGNIGKSIHINGKRFGYGKTLQKIFCNTVQLYCMGRRNHVAYYSQRKELAPITTVEVMDKWKEHPTDETLIIGTWAEDGTEYTLKVPSQLRPAIILMQNEL